MKTLRVLNVEDSERDTALLTRYLTRVGYDLSLQRVETAAAMKAALKTGEWDVILCDYSMPKFNALSALKLLHELELDVPLIIISGTVGEAVAVEAMRAGAHDYLMKDNLVRLGPTIERELHEAENRRARRLAEEALRESEERYKGLIDSAFDGVVIMRDRTIMTANRAYAEMFGYAVEELVGMDVLQLTSEAEFVRSRIAANERRYETIGLKKDGTQINIEVSAKVCLYQGQPARLSAVRDITERKRGEQALRESEERYRDLIENARDIIYTHDLQGNYTSTNKASEVITGYTQAESLKLNLADAVAPEYLEKARRMLEGKLEGEAETIYDLELIAKDGHRVAVEVNTRLVFEANAPVAVQGIARDVTERKRAQAMQIRRGAQQALRGDINSALAETNTPLRRLLEHCSEAMVQHLDVALARIWTFNRNEEMLELEASAGMYTQLEGSLAHLDVGAFNVSRIAENHLPHTTNDILSDRKVGDKQWARREGMIAFAGYPLIVEARVIGVMAVFSRQRLADDTLDALSSVADIISQGIERKRAEEALQASEDQLRQSQKLEAVGQLAGGVAHDFNNLLTVINGYSDLLMRRMSQGDEMRSKVEEIKKAGERAASLTRQLLAFSRKQVLQPKVLQLNAVVTDVEKMLRRLIGEDIDLITVLDPSLGQIKADPGQIQQVIINLAVNARDAMPQGGKLTIETRNVHLDNEFARKHATIRAGDYVMLAICDTGMGMDAETQARIFEPFFTTKEPGKGTGLGCATVYGIVRQSDGNIWVSSEPGKGTTFKVYLPAVLNEAQSEIENETSAALPQGREKVLLTEDEEPVRRLTKTILEINGYQVFEASDGDEALALHEKHRGEFDLIITDVVMPNMSGPQLAESLEAKSPGLKVLYLSGYTDDAIVRHGLLDQKVNFLQKPFTPDALLRKVREVLDRNSV
jgi:two-component system cell cycle sensor histidine kinase/response regulator CckA